MVAREKSVGETQYGVVVVEGTSAVCDLYERALPCLDANDTKTARALYEHALVLEPGNAQGHIGLASCAMQENDLDGATKGYLRALELDPRSASAHVGLGSAHYQRREFPQSAEHYEQALRIDADLADAHWGAATAFERLGNRKKLRAHLRRFLELAPTSALAWRARRMLFTSLL